MVDDQGNPRSYCMGVQDRENPQDARVLVRGEIDQPGPVVREDFPSVVRRRRRRSNGFERPTGVGQVDRQRRQPADRAGDGQSNLAEHDRPRHRHFDRKLWRDRSSPQSSRVAGLLGGAVRRSRVGRSRRSFARSPLARLSNQFGVRRSELTSTIPTTRCCGAPIPDDWMRKRFAMRC